MSLNDPQWGKRGNSGPPDLDEIWRNVNRKVNDLFKRRGSGDDDGGGGGGPRASLPLSGVGILVALVLVVWLASGFYIVDESQRGVVLTFGKHSKTTGPGLQWRMPYPFQSHELVNLSQVRTIEIGYRNNVKTRVLNYKMLSKQAKKLRQRSLKRESKKSAIPTETIMQT